MGLFLSDLSLSYVDELLWSCFRRVSYPAFTSFSQRESAFRMLLDYVLLSLRRFMFFFISSKIFSSHVLVAARSAAEAFPILLNDRFDLMFDDSSRIVFDDLIVPKLTHHRKNRSTKDRRSASSSRTS